MNPILREDTHRHVPSPYARTIMVANPGSRARSFSRVFTPAVTSVRIVALNQACPQLCTRTLVAGCESWAKSRVLA